MIFREFMGVVVEVWFWIDDDEYEVKFVFRLIVDGDGGFFGVEIRELKLGFFKFVVGLDKV